MKRTVLVLGAAVLAGACSEAPIPTAAPAVVDRPEVSAFDAEGWRGSNQHYVAIGTSISMGWLSNGVYEGTQRQSWPALLGFATLNPISLPLIQSPGCTSPLVAPLGDGKRLSGESASGSTVCAQNVEGVTLPTQNVGIAGAITVDAITRTPESAGSPPWYRRVLPSGATQVSAALGQRPTFVSVELGGNDILGVTSGLIAPGVTFVPFPFFAQAYKAVLDAVGSSGAKAVLFGMPKEARNIPALRQGDEIWQNRDEFAALNVDVSPDCEGNQNWINVSIKSLNMVFTAAFTSTHGLPNPVYSCADIPGTPDQVLTPNDIIFVNTTLGQMHDFARDQAAARGYAYAELGALYEHPQLKAAPYSVVRQMTSQIPYGPFISLDGVHPSRLGHVLLAIEAARATNATYGARFTRANATASLVADEGGTELMTASQALEMARAVAREHSNMQLGPCSIPGDCRVDGKSWR